MKDVVWKLFEKTGNTAYYLLYKELTKDGSHNQGHSSQNDRLRRK
ncbi:MAG: YqzL family protein [Clostridia bacterium]|nr:YqzL family protein [Clostridia bacterium]